MKYTIKFIDGSTLAITEEEYQFFITSKDTFITLKRNGHTFNRSSVSKILPTSDFLEEQKSADYKGKMGTLHDGKQVFKAFGKWFTEDSILIDDKGVPKYTECFWDYSYYPEIASDQVKTPTEYAQWLLVKNEVPYLANQELHPKLRVDNGFQKLF